MSPTRKDSLPMGKHRPTPTGEPIAALLVRLNPPPAALLPPTHPDDDTDVLTVVRPSPRSRVAPWAAGAAVVGVALTGLVVAPHAVAPVPLPYPASVAADLPNRHSVSQAVAADRIGELAASRASKSAEQVAAVQVQEATEKAAQESQDATESAPAAQVPAEPSQAATQATSTAAAPTESAPSGPAADIAVQTAMDQLGKPYVWGAEGPGSFDCSGLVLFAYQAAGISLPRVSSDQAQAGVAVSRADLQPGDLVAFYSPVSHIGIYIGNGQIVHAPEPGDVVKVTDIDAFGSAPTAYRRVA